MSDIKLFSIKSGKAFEIQGSASALEKSLQDLIERNLDAMLGIRFLETEYSTGKQHGGRIDTLGLDENGCPVIIEYKRATNENVVTQGLFYLDWLMDHQAEFKLLVMEKLGAKISEGIDWSAPRLVCIAGGFNKYDEHAVKQMNRNIELIRYMKFGNDLLLLELVNSASVESNVSSKPAKGSPSSYKTISETFAHLKGPLRDLYEELRAHLLALGDDAQEKTLKYYFAYKRIRNFACVEVLIKKKCLLAFLKLDPDTMTMESGFSRDVRKIGHYGTGDVELTIRSRGDLEKAKPLFQKSYDSS